MSEILIQQVAANDAAEAEVRAVVEAKFALLFDGVLGSFYEKQLPLVLFKYGEAEAASQQRIAENEARIFIAMVRAMVPRK